MRCGIGSLCPSGLARAGFPIAGATLTQPSTSGRMKSELKERTPGAKTRESKEQNLRCRSGQSTSQFVAPGS